MYSKSKIVILALCLIAPGLWADDNAECASCHDKGRKMQNTVHAGMACLTCHEDHEKYPHPANAAKPVCSECHEKQASEDARGVHGIARAKGNAAAPDCEVCHGDAHEMKSPSSEAFRKGVPDTCGMCHTEIASQFKNSVHGKAVERGVTQAPICTDCHGEHSIQGPQRPPPRQSTPSIFRKPAAVATPTCGWRGGSGCPRMWW